MITKDRIEEIREKNKYVLIDASSKNDLRDLLEYIDQQKEEIKTKNGIIQLHQSIEKKHKAEIERLEKENAGLKEKLKQADDDYMMATKGL